MWYAIIKWVTIEKKVYCVLWLWIYFEDEWICLQYIFNFFGNNLYVSKFMLLILINFNIFLKYLEYLNFYTFCYYWMYLCIFMSENKYIITYLLLLQDACTKYWALYERLTHIQPMRRNTSSKKIPVI